jgi:4'-phosphopantetheinyl transferase
LARSIVEAGARRAGALGEGEPARFHRLPGGKPVLGGWHFSVSHAGGWVVVAAAAFPVGVDVEDLGRDVAPALARRLAPEERAWLEPWSGERFLELWTKKEACLKWLGTGVAGGLDAFNVLRPDGIGAELRRLDLPAGLVGHVCAGAGLIASVDGSWPAGPE